MITLSTPLPILCSLAAASLAVACSSGDTSSSSDVSGKSASGSASGAMTALSEAAASSGYTGSNDQSPPLGTTPASGSDDASAATSGTLSTTGAATSGDFEAGALAMSGGNSGSMVVSSGMDSGAMTSFDASVRSEAGVPNTSMADAGERTHSGVWTIVPFGDSITGSMCPPQLLSQELITNNHKNFVFTGSNLNNQNCYGAPNVYTEGHGGYLVTDLVGSGKYASDLPKWCAADKADVVLLLMGTNDVWNSKPVQSILDAFTTVLTDFRSIKPNVIMFVGKITPLHPSACSNCEANVEALNAQIPSWASSHSTGASPVYLVDINSVFNQATYLPGSTYTSDGVHPNPAGSKLVADKWYQALVAQGIP